MKGIANITIRTGSFTSCDDCLDVGDDVGPGVGCGVGERFGVGKGVRPAVGVGVGAGVDVGVGPAAGVDVGVGPAAGVDVGVRPAVGVGVTVDVEEGVIVGDEAVGDSAGEAGEGALPHATNIVQHSIMIMSEIITLDHLSDTLNLLFEASNMFPSTQTTNQIAI